MLALGLATTTTPILQASPSMMVIPTPSHPAPPRPSSTATYPAATSSPNPPDPETLPSISLSEPGVALFGGSFGTGAWPAPDETLCPDIQPEFIHWPELAKTACHQAADLTHTTRNRTLISPVTRCKQNDRFVLSPVGCQARWVPLTTRHIRSPNLIPLVAGNVPMTLPSLTLFETTCFLMRHAMAIDKCSCLVAVK
ncbi:hypothetical protein PG996_004380 [Apiospora saccharicola]|uniref:Uncharacterized protein n=1 Tax=Apiospora saccharicola TaxID=335842 RepID=A0ABR1W3Z4_9PEZI